MKGGWGRIVWMPSWDSEHTSRISRNWPAGRPFVSVAKDKELLPEVKEAIAVIAKTRTRDSNGELILATGHNSPEEVLMMIREAKRVGVRNVIVTHPLLESVGMNHEQMKEAAKLGAYLEFVSSFSRGARVAETTKEYVEAIRAVGVEHCFVSSDLGQLTTPFPPDGLAAAAKALRANGFTERELDILFKENPAKILGLPAPASK
jgi:predicted metal-dependent phosphotriesterase family hydrolase